MEENKVEQKRIYNIVFKNEYTNEIKEFGDCTDLTKRTPDIGSYELIMFDDTKGATHFIDLGQCLLDIRMDRERSKTSEDTYYFDVKIKLLTKTNFEELWNR